MVLPIISLLYIACTNADPYETPATNSLPINLGSISYQHGFGFSSSLSPSSFMVGVGGSATSCSRSHSMPLMFVPVSSALSTTTKVELSVQVSNNDKMVSYTNVDLYGLGLRSTRSILDADFYAGESGSDPRGTLPQASFVTASTPLGSPTTLDVTTYVNSLYSEWNSRDETQIWFGVFRLNFSTDLGCLSACDGSCSIKRVIFSSSLLDILLTIPPTLNPSPSNFISQSHQSSLFAATCQGDGRLQLDFVPDVLGGVMIDYSTVGYAQGGGLPLTNDLLSDESEDVTVVAVYPSTSEEDCLTTLAESAGYLIKEEIVSCVSVDDAGIIQAAVDAVSSLPPNGAGIRGVVLLSPGSFFVKSPISIEASGVVLRGSGESGEGSTTLWATLREAGFNLIQVGVGSSTRRSEDEATRANIAADVQVGAKSLSVLTADAAPFTVGATIVVSRAASPEWIADLGMDDIPNCEEPSCRSWDADGYRLKFERTVTGVDVGEGEEVTVLTMDFAIPHHITEAYGGGSIALSEWSEGGRLRNVGIHGLSLKSVYESEGGTLNANGEEDHASNMVLLNNVEER